MSTWLSDLKKKDPKLAHAYSITGNQDTQSLRNMVAALSHLGIMNTREENERLAAAQYILRNAGKRKKNPVSMQNIEKSRFHKNEYVGYAVGTVWKITKGGEGWRATAREHYPDSTYPGYLSARTLADLSVKLEGLYKTGGINSLQDAERARKKNPALSLPHPDDMDALAPMRYFVQMGKHGNWASVARFSVLTDAKDFAKKKSVGSSFAWRVFEKKPR